MKYLLSLLLLCGLLVSNAPQSLVFDEEFSGSALNTSKWVSHINVSSIGLSTFAPSQVTVSGGALHLKAVRSGTGYLSGAISTIGKYSFTYGKATVRARVPAGKGLWPAWWLLTIHDNDALQSRQEIDIMEDRGSMTNTTFFNIHWGIKGATYQTGGKLVVPGVNYSTGWHTYTVQWQKGSARFYVDGSPAWSFISVNVPSDPMKLMLDLAVGGTYDGNPPSTTVFPAYLDVDYVRVYQ